MHSMTVSCGESNRRISSSLQIGPDIFVSHIYCHSSHCWFADQSNWVWIGFCAPDYAVKTLTETLNLIPEALQVNRLTGQNSRHQRFGSPGTPWSLFGRDHPRIFVSIGHSRTVSFRWKGACSFSASPDVTFVRDFPRGPQEWDPNSHSHTIPILQILMEVVGE